MPTGIVRCKVDPTTFYVDGQTWQCGKRYVLVKKLGQGSFSQVCLAQDTETGGHVALKRIPEINNNSENAKRVLREVAILRRLNHPNIIRLYDAWMCPSSTGPKRYKGGKFVSVNNDLYLAMEYADGGDLFSLKGQLREEEVKFLMWQLMGAVSFLHRCNVWHRDLKSANVLLSFKDGLRIVKIADLGSARSASDQGYHSAEQKPAAAMKPIRVRARPPGAVEEDGQEREDMELDSPSSAGEPEGNGIEPLLCQDPSTGRYRTPLTRTICTPCYRAPEVVMSRGGYTSALDMWSLGCIFGELLQRVIRVGSASTPSLQVAPVFAMHGLINTPTLSQSWDDPSSATTRKELETLFAVIGTPSWAAISRVHSREWGHYLHSLPVAAATLYRRYDTAGEVAVDLLARLLEFDPELRCGADEAIHHEYFWELPLPLRHWVGDQEVPSPSLMASPIKQSPERSYSRNVEQDGLEMEAAAPAGPAAAEAGGVEGLSGQLAECSCQIKRRRHSVDTTTSSTSSTAPSRAAHYYDIGDPATALAALETEMVRLSSSSPEGGVDELSRLIQRECTMQHSAAGGRAAPGSGSVPDGQRPHSADHASWRSWLRSSGAGIPQRAGLQADPGYTNDDPNALHAIRVSGTSGLFQVHTSAEVHLKRGRHADWTPTTGQLFGPQAGPTWGVTAVPPGMEGQKDPFMLGVISHQQGR